MTDRAQKEKLIREIYAARVNNDMETIGRAFARRREVPDGR